MERQETEQESTAFLDSTVQEKNITSPTDCKFLLKIIDWSEKVSRKEGASTSSDLPQGDQGSQTHNEISGMAKDKKAVAKADRRLRTIAGWMCRELDRLLAAGRDYRERLAKSLMFINGEKLEGHKIYSLHEPDVVCIAKGNSILNPQNPTSGTF